MGFLNDQVSFIVLSISSVVFLVFHLILRLFLGRKRKLLILVRQPNTELEGVDYLTVLKEDGRYLEKVFRLQGFSFRDINAAETTVEEFKRILSDDLESVEEHISLFYMGSAWFNEPKESEEDPRVILNSVSPYDRGIVFKDGERLSDGEFFRFLHREKANDDLVVNVASFVVNSKITVLSYNPDVDHHIKNLLSLSVSQRTHTRFFMVLVRIVYTHSLEFQELYDIIQAFGNEAGLLSELHANPRELIYSEVLS